MLLLIIGCGQEGDKPAARDVAAKGMHEKAKQGIFPGYAPIGYINVHNGDLKIIQPDPERAPYIKKLFEWYSTGNYSVREISKMIRTEALTYRKTSNKVSKSTVHGILTNPIY
jgi:DNA invertase Pin-like site-specific DNA recombinase